METQIIKKLLEKYFEGDTSQEEERILSTYFNHNNVDESLLPYISLFRQFTNEKQVKAPIGAANKLKVLQQNTIKKRRNRIHYIGISIAASIIILLSIGLFRNNDTATDNQFVMYINGKRISDPVVALEYTNKQLNKVNATMSKANTIINKPVNTIESSLEPIQKIAKQLNKVEKYIDYK